MRRARPRAGGHMHYGGDYNPEQWPRQIWREDVARMREAGVTMVSLGIFSWSRIQPAEGVFDFEWLDEVMALLHEGGIAVDLATATASPPPWAVTAYPDILPVDENGATYWHGSRQHYAPTSPSYRRLASELVGAIASRYAQHPAVVLWHVNNEYGCHVAYDYSDSAAVAFRAWLERRYGSLDALNAAWGTDFWSQKYTDFAEIVPPRKTPASPNPAGMLDFKRFSSDALLELYLMEKRIIRSSGATQPITTNFMGSFAPVDYWEWARHVDVVTDDSYPDPNDPEAFRDAAFTRDLMRSLKPEVPWLLMEQASNAVNWRPSNAPKAPGQMAALSRQAVARGADGILFFQWRQSRAGSEKFHSAMLPYAGTDTRTWREVTALGAQLAALPELPAGTSDADVAIVFDWQNRWAIGNPDHPVALDYEAIAYGWYRAIHRRHVQVDFALPGADLSRYKVVIAPQLYLLESDAAAALLAYVDGGGHLLVGAFSDVVDENDAFRDGGFLTQLGPTLGVRVEEFGALVPPGSGGPGESRAQVAGVVPFTGTLLAEELHVDGATVLGSYVGGRADGRAAFTVAGSGAGSAYYLGTVPDEEGCGVVADHVFAAAGVAPLHPGLPSSVEVARRGDVLTFINHGTADARLDPPAGIDLATGEPARPVVLAPFEYVAVRTS